MSDDGRHLPAGVTLSVEGVSKRQTLVHEIRYTPTTSIGSRLRSKRDGLPLPLGDAGGEVDEDEDDEEEDEEADAAEEHREVREGWLLREVSFELAGGEAVALVGDDESVTALVRILSGMTAPSGGRVLHRGRVGLSAELARLLARRDLADPRIAVRVLARMSGTPRRDRADWVRAVGELVADGSSTAAGLALPPRVARTRLPIAASLDPFAAVLLVDSLPGRSNPDFLDRCVERLRRRLEEGAAAVVACSDPLEVAELCSRAIRLEDGSIVASGPATEIVAELRREAKARRRRDAGPPRGFNEDAAIISVELTTRDGDPVHVLAPDDDLEVEIRFETSHPQTSVLWRLVASGPESASVEQRKSSVLEASGAYLATLRLPPAALAEGEYDLEVQADVEAGGRRSTLARPLPGTYRSVSSWVITDSAVLDTDGLVAEWELVEEPDTGRQ